MEYLEVDVKYEDVLYIVDFERRESSSDWGNTQIAIYSNGKLANIDDEEYDIIHHIAEGMFGNDGLIVKLVSRKKQYGEMTFLNNVYSYEVTDSHIFFHLITDNVVEYSPSLSFRIIS